MPTVSVSNSPFMNAWRNASVEERHTLVSGLFETIVVGKDGKLTEVYRAHPEGMTAQMPTGNRHSALSKALRRDLNQLPTNGALPRMSSFATSGATTAGS